jgi:hypothetical protein
MCNTVNEGQTLTLTAPAGNVFLSITFASYGTPNGSCGSFTIGGCHAANSVSIAQSTFIGHNSASLGANNGVFGDPCVGTGKRLYIEAVYGAPLPVKIISFSGNVNGNVNALKWETANEINAKQFIVQRSNDGINFSDLGTVMANNTANTNKYSFNDNLFQSGTNLYRLKMMDIDGKFSFSTIIKLSGNSSGQIDVFPNPGIDVITLSGLHNKGMIELINAQGKTLKRIVATAQSQTVDINNYPAGLYFIKYVFNDQVTIQKLVKQ